MKNILKPILALCLCAPVAVPVSAAIIVDGVLDADYGAPVVIQTVQTGFGDSDAANNLAGSELDAAYMKVQGGRLFMMFTGNQEPNFNKLDIFIDSVPGGESTLSATPDYDFNPGGGWISSNLAGLTFDKGFEADYHLFSRWGGGIENPGPFEVDFINRQGGASAMVPGNAEAGSATVGQVSTGSIAPGSLGPNASGAALTQSLDFAIDNNNSAGVTGGDGAADQIAALQVTTGMEFSIALADIGSPGLGDRVLISAMINNGDHNFLSNQILGGLEAPQGNLGGDGMGGFTGTLGGVDFNNYGRVQDFKVLVPEPTSGFLGLSLLAVLFAARRRP
jgi:MYXO-CTERM domain-containing protein